MLLLFFFFELVELLAAHIQSVMQSEVFGGGESA